MKYRVLLHLLRILIYIKRFFWWIGARIYFVLAKIVGFVGRLLIYIKYRISYVIKKLGLNLSRGWFFKRDFLQFLLFVILLFIGFQQTTFFSKRNLALAAQKTAINNFFLSGNEIETEEIIASDSVAKTDILPSWRAGVLENQSFTNAPNSFFNNNIISGIVVGGTALSKPVIMPGATMVGGTRDRVIEYVVEPGDSIGGIANLFSVNIATIIWENNLTAKSIIRPGDVLKIPPTSGVMHTIKKGDNLKKIAKLYDTEIEPIVKFNHLKEDGTDLIIGERIMVPDGVRPQEREIARAPRISRTARTVASKVAIPPASTVAPSASGFTWPSGAHTITQYFNLRHNALDIAGAWQTPTYAARDGVVEKAQCGWNSGYGCYVVINHGGGVKTLYGHHSQLLVSPGETVTAGQTIALMGNTGNVRGRTGIHLHFEVIVNGVHVNPLGYVR